MSDETPRRAELVAGSEVAPIIPRTVEEVGRVADAVIAAGMVPKSYEGSTPAKTKAMLMIGVMKGLEVGFGPITALSTICVINNRPCLWGDGAVALCQRSGSVEWVTERFFGEEGKDDWTAAFRIKRRGQSEVYEGQFSVKDAKRAHLWGNPKRTPWIEYPQRMLLARARAFALREGFADFLMGLSIAEEIQDLPPEAPAKADLAFLDAPTEEPLDGTVQPAPEEEARAEIAK